MWYGKDTSELIELKEKYEKKFGYNPDGEIELEEGIHAQSRRLFR